MGVTSLSQFTVSIDGTPLTCVSDPTAPTPGSAGYGGTYVAQDSTKTLEQRDVPVFIRRFSRGGGFVEMRDEDDDGGYAWGEDVITYLGNGVMPSGRRTLVSNLLGLGASGSTLPIQSEIFHGDLWCPMANAARMLRYASCDPTALPVHDPALNTFGSATDSFHAGYRTQCLAVFADATGTPALYVGCYNSGTGGTRIYQYTVAGGWTASAVFTIRADRMAVVWWTGRDGVGALRLAIRSSTTGEIRHCIYGQNPLAEASYVTPITVGNPGYASRFDLVAGEERLFVVKDDGIWDFNELRCWNLTPYWRQTANGGEYSSGSLIYDSHIVATRQNGIDRYDLNLRGQRQSVPGECAPMAFMQDGTPVRGVITALCEHDGWLLAAVFNPDNKTSYIMRGKDRRVLNIDVPNPIVWYGAEQVLTPIAGQSVRVFHMRVAQPSSTAALSGATYLWLFAAVNWEIGATDYVLYYAPLPTGSGPLALQASGGTFNYNPTARLFLTSQTWLDRNAWKGVRRYDLVSRQTTATSTIELRTRGDGAPSTIADPNQYAVQGTATSNSTSITPATQVTGHSLALLATLTTPSPYTAPPILHEISARARLIREVFEVRKLWILLERGTELVDGQPDLRNPDSVLSTIVGLQNDPTTSGFTDEKRRSYTVYVEQGIKYSTADLGDGEWRTVAGVEISIVG